MFMDNKTGGCAIYLDGDNNGNIPPSSGLQLPMILGENTSITLFQIPRSDYFYWRRMVKNMTPSVNIFLTYTPINTLPLYSVTFNVEVYGRDRLKVLTGIICADKGMNWYATLLFFSPSSLRSPILWDDMMPTKYIRHFQS